MARGAVDSYQALQHGNVQCFIWEELSTMGFIHTKRQNSLNVETVEKLVFVKSNLPAFHEQQLLVDDDYESKANDSDHFTGNE